jgi:ectoine hydroxylase-related dioxygenase (phytanoyl-CoA dioxygenase family)
VNEPLDRNGFEILEAVLASGEIESLRRAVGEIPKLHRGGTRNLLADSKAITEMAKVGPVKSIADAALGAACFPVRALFFDKSATANWNVAWHQDTTIAVAERIDIPGFSGWSVKNGVPHVHPPAAILEHMVALRIHLDDCRPDNGPLRVLPGSHQHGKFSAAEILKWRERTPEVTCSCAAGSVVAIRPLLLHASSRAHQPTHRRVIHIEYAHGTLPAGLRWFEAGGKSIRDH